MRLVICAACCLSPLSSADAQFGGPCYWTSDASGNETLQSFSGPTSCTGVNGEFCTTPIWSRPCLNCWQYTACTGTVTGGNCTGTCYYSSQSTGNGTFGWYLASSSCSTATGCNCPSSIAVACPTDTGGQTTAACGTIAGNCIPNSNNSGACGGPCVWQYSSGSQTCSGSTVYVAVGGCTGSCQFYGQDDNNENWALFGNGAISNDCGGNCGCAYTVGQLAAAGLFRYGTFAAPCKNAGAQTYTWQLTSSTCSTGCTANPPTDTPTYAGQIGYGTCTGSGTGTAGWTKVSGTCTGTCACASPSGPAANGSTQNTDCIPPVNNQQSETCECTHSFTDRLNQIRTKLTAVFPTISRTQWTGGSYIKRTVSIPHNFDSGEWQMQISLDPADWGAFAVTASALRLMVRAALFLFFVFKVGHAVFDLVRRF